MTEKDLLISRIVDREDSAADWQRLDALATRNGAVYDHLIEVLRDAAALREVVGERLAVADRVDVELAAVRPGWFARHPWVPLWSGWLAAAALILVWLATGLPPRASHTGALAGGGRHDARPGGAPADRPADRPPDRPASRTAEPGPVQARLATDGLLRELPHLMVETRAIPGSDQTEVIYVRRTLQRAVVSGAYTLARDEVGQPIRTDVDLSRYAPRAHY